MTTVAWILLAVGGLFAVADWVAVARRDKRLEYVAKPATLVAFVGAAVALDPSDPAQRAWFVAALVASLAGDVFLMLDRFVPGLAAFLAGHIAYIVGLRMEGGNQETLLAAGIGILLIGLVVGSRVVGALRSGADAALTGPVVAYMIVISAMVACATAAGDPRAVAAAWLFYFSDATIAWTRFVRPLAWGPLSIIVTYHAAQALFVLSLAS